MRLAWKRVRDRFHQEEKNVPVAFAVQYRNLIAMMEFFIPIVTLYLTLGMSKLS